MLVLVFHSKLLKIKEFWKESVVEEMKIPKETQNSHTINVEWANSWIEELESHHHNQNGDVIETLNDLFGFSNDNNLLNR